MVNNFKKHFKKISLIIVLITVFTFAFNITDVFSEEQDEYCLSLNVDYSNGFSSANVSSVKVNNTTWTSGQDLFYGSVDENNTLWTIVFKVGKYGDEFPFVSTAGGLVIDDPNDPDYPGYGSYLAIPNPDEDPNVEGDEYIVTVTLKNNWDNKGDPNSNPKVCGNYGVMITSGPPITVPDTDENPSISISISGAELEYHYVANSDEDDVARFKIGINNGVYENDQFVATSSNGLIPFRFNNVTFKNDIMPPNAIGARTTNDITEYHYGYDGSGYVEFCVNGGAADNYTKIQISGKSNNQSADYSDQAPHSQVEVYEHVIGRASMFCIENVPYDPVGYDIVVEGERQPDVNQVTGFGWSYLNEIDSQGEFAHGRLEFVSARYTDIDNVEHVFNSVNDYNNTKYHGIGEIYEWRDGRKDYEEEDRRQAWGEALVPNGTELTVRIVPDEGYQLIGLTNNSSFTATDTPGVYTIIVNRSNLYSQDADAFKIGAVFVEVGATVVADATNVAQGEITVPEGQNAFEIGTPKLEVSDVASMSEQRRDSFEEAAEQDEFEIDNYLEISLYNALYKGGKKDNNNNYLSWDTAVSNLENNAKATVTLQLEDEVANRINGKDVEIIHEIHDGQTPTDYEVINAVYNSENKTITFETGSFSTFAIATKGNNQQPVQHTVTFRETDETEISHVLIDDGAFVNKPSDPPAPDNNSHFDGWFEDKNHENEFDFEHHAITSDISIYALWSNDQNQNKFEVRFDSVGGEPVDTQFVEEGNYAIEPNPAPTKEGYLLEGWYLDDEFINKFDFSKTKITDHVDLIAHWVRDVQNPEDYSVDDGSGNIIEFVEETGHTFTLNIVDFMALSKEDVMALAGLTSEEYDEYIDAVKDAVKENGTLIGMYGIDLVDDVTGNNVEDGPLTIKIKLTEEMKKYNTIKLIYVDDGNGFKTQTPITLTVEGDYAVGTLKHLSFYAMTGSNEESSNPKTNDNVMFYVSILGLSAIGLIGTGLFIIKKKSN